MNNEINAVLAFLVSVGGCAFAAAYLHPGFAEWLALKIAARAVYLRATRKAGMRVRQQFIADNQNTIEQLSEEMQHR